MDVTGKRVAIMSMQRIYNYGSSLQAYALRRLIETSGSAAEVSFVDYRPGAVLVADDVSVSPVPADPLRRSWAKLREYGQVDASLVDRLRFVNHKRHYARAYFPALGIPAHRQGPTEDLDVQVIGSDEVFNCVQSNTRVGFSRDLFGHGSQARRLVSYAASFGNTTISKIDAHGIRKVLQEDLSRFDALSLRDDNSAAIVEELTGRPAQVHVDPAIAFDFPRLEPRIPVARLHPRPYLLVYGYSGRLTAEENAVLRRLANRRGADILSFGGLQPCADKFVDCHPFELLAYFRDAEAVVTDTFHGTIFSLINHRPFGTIVRRSLGEGYGNEEKLTDLLRRFGLESRRIEGLADVERVLEQPIDAAIVERTVAKERARSRSFVRAEILGY